MNKLIEKLWDEGKKIIQFNDLSEIAQSIYYNYKNMINYLVRTKQIIKIYRDYYYIKDIKEIQAKNFLTYTPLELLSKVLEMEFIQPYYFGLYTSFRKFNVSTKNHPEEYLICSKIPHDRSEIKLLGKKIHVIKLSEEICGFGIVNDKVKYSYLEKTILDFAYIWKMNGAKAHKITKILQQYKERISIQKILNYSSNYPKDISHIIEEAFNNENFKEKLAIF